MAERIRPSHGRGRDRDGTMTGYDVDFVRRVVESVSIPVIASGGAGNYDHMHEVIRRAGASVALVDLMEVVTRLCKAPFRWAARVGISLGCGSFGTASLKRESVI